MPLPPEKQALLDRILALLTPIPGVRAVVLGGSTARGTARPDSDLDIGVYYAESAPFAIEDIRRAAVALSGDENQEVTDFYGWGAWVNGGSWIHTPGGKVDFIYRNLDQVQRTIEDAHRGITYQDFDQQPAFGFYSVIYLAETRACLPLYDPQGEIDWLKRQVEVYPPRLKEKVIASTLWLAEFSLLHADKSAAAGDIYMTVATLLRVASFLTQALFALNETYFAGDKTALQEMSAFAILPPGFIERLTAVLAHPGKRERELQAAVVEMRGLWTDLVQLTGGSYRPAFKM